MPASDIAMPFSEQALRQGRRLLRSLIPSARANLKNNKGRTEIGSQLGIATAAYCTEDNMDALMIYPAPLGGWHADVLFKNIPPGVPNTFGTPVSSPVATYEAALETGKKVLMSVLQLAEQNREGKFKKGKPVFIFHDIVFPLLPELFAAAQSKFPDVPVAGGYGSRELALERLAVAEKELIPEGVENTDAKTWDRTRLVQFLCVLHIASLDGIFRYPPKVDASPSGHTEAETSKAKH